MDARFVMILEGKEMSRVRVQQVDVGKTGGSEEEET